MDDEDVRDLARRVWQSDGSVEIDSDAVVSESSDGGWYVQAWVWVDKPDEEDDEES